MQLLKILLLTGSIQGFILATVLFFRRFPGTRIFAVLLCLLSFHLILVAFDEQSFYLRFPHLLHITWVMPLLYGPLVILYFRRISRISPAFKPVELLFFIPFLASVLYQLPFFLQSATFKMEYIHDFDHSVTDDFGMMNQITNFFHLVFFTHALFEFQLHKKHIVQYYSDIRKVQMTWYHNFIRIIFILVIFSIVVFYSRKWQVTFLKDIYPYHFLGIVITIYWTGYKVLRQPLLFGGNVPSAFMQHMPEAPATAEMITEEIEPVVKINSLLAKELENKILNLMEKEKWYLKSDLTIQDVTVRLKTNKQYISEVINRNLGKNFYDFINDYRIDEFKNLTAQPGSDRMNILGMAYEAGFNSKATFNAVFKKKTGLTPSQYIRQSMLKTVQV
jgi:AraC-like DNA-binding protein